MYTKVKILFVTKVMKNENVRLHYLDAVCMGKLCSLFFHTILQIVKPYFLKDIHNIRNDSVLHCSVHRNLYRDCLCTLQ